MRATFLRGVRLRADVTEKESVMQQIQKYREQSRQFLAQAQQELAAGDLPQASEKAWGAVAQMVKAWAAQ